MRKLISGLIAVSLLASLFAGCGSQNGKKNSGNEKTAITFSFWEPGVEKELETSIGEIVADYEAIHPEVKIELISQPVAGYQEWIKAQIVADNMPDIESNNGAVLEEQWKAGYIENISEAFNAPNQYFDNRIWKDTFLENRLQQAQSYKYDASYAVPLFGVGVGIYYNKTMYDQLGLSIPKTWKEFMHNNAVIKNAGKTPIAFMAQKADAISWLSWELEIGLFGQKFFSDPNLNFNGDYAVLGNEFSKSVYSGYMNFTKNKDYQDILKKYVQYLKEYLQYCPDASGIDEAAAKTMFLSGNVGHIHTGSWDIQGLMMNKEIGFEVGSFEFPKFTKEDSEYYTKGMDVAACQPVAVTTNVKKHPGKKEAVVDFLQFLTSSKEYSKFINNSLQISTVKDVEVSDIFKGFMKVGFAPVGFFSNGSSSEGISLRDITERTVVGENIQPNDELFANVQKSLERQVSDSIKAGEDTPENDFNISKLPIQGGEYSPENAIAY